jgi:1-deoxy-D-xylulose-5-phosphate reductoisomerase
MTETLPTALAARFENTSKAPRCVTVLGATGSIGESTLDLLARNASSYRVVALTGGRNAARLAELALRHRPDFVAVADPAAYPELRDRLAGTDIDIAAGEDAVIEAASRSADWIMAAIVGAAGLKPTLAAIQQGTCTALANKECLVSAGVLFMDEVALHGTTLLPVDSEHSAAMQAMGGRCSADIERMCLTASGGPFRLWSLAEMTRVTPKQALAHPNWSMGPKVTIDSATLMNKALELIEAHHFFSVEAGRLEVLIHPQSIVHCLVHYRDGSVIAQMSCPDMRTPIAYSLAWPDRMATPTERLDLAKLGTLDFAAPDERRFPSLRMAREVLAAGGGATTVLNAANEIAVEAFLSERLGFLAITGLVEATLEKAADLAASRPESVDDVLAVDAEARAVARALLPQFAQAAPAI